MSEIRASWQAMATRSRVLAVAGLLVPLVLVTALVGGLALGATPPSPPPVADAPLPAGSSPSHSPDLRATPADTESGGVGDAVGRRPVRSPPESIRCWARTGG